VAVNILHVNDKQCRIVIDGEMTIYTAMELNASLLPPLMKYAEVEMDLAGVNEVDTAGLQLLVLAKNEAVAQDKILHISAHSPAVLDILSLCDLEGFFGDPVVISSQE